MAVEFTELLPEILALAPACPTPTAVRALRTAARNLCEQAECYQYDMDNIVVVNSVAETELDVPADTVLHKPISLTIGGNPLVPSSPTLLDEEVPDWRDNPGTPCKYYRSTENMNEIVLAPTPNATLTNGIRGRVAVKPTRTATEVSDAFMDQYQDIIVDGALGALLMVRSAPWYNPELGGVHLAMFNASVNDAKARGHGDDMYKPRKVRYGGL